MRRRAVAMTRRERGHGLAVILACAMRRELGWKPGLPEDRLAESDSTMMIGGFPWLCLFGENTGACDGGAEAEEVVAQDRG